jgi:PadR family transcriptional regulator PadR
MLPDRGQQLRALAPRHVDAYNVGIVPGSLGEFEQLVLLAVLRAGEGAYGTRILEEVRAAGGRRASRGAVYVTLARLEDKRLLRARLAEVSPGRGGRPRRYLRVTSEGLRALRSSRATLLRLWTGLEGVLGEAEG